jgi:PKD repeat protein
MLNINKQILKDRAKPYFRVIIITSMLLIMFFGSLTTVSANQAPFANAGSNQYKNTGQTVIFNGGGSWDPDNDTLSYYWDFGDGYFSWWNSSFYASHIYWTAGNYTVTLNVTDGFLYDTDTCMVFVTQASGNSAPIANAGSDQTVPVNTEVDFDGSGSYDPDSDPLMYYWDFNDGNSSGWMNSSYVNHTYASPGYYYVKLSVTDGPLISNDTCVINVTLSNYPPVPIAGPDKYGKINEWIFFNGSASYDPDYDTLSYMWYFGDGDSTNWSMDPTAYHKYNATGTFNAYLGVKDYQHYKYDLCKVYINTSGNNPPVAAVGSDQYGKVGSQVYFYSGYSYDPDDDPLLYKWDFGDGTASGWTNLTTVSHIYYNVGNYSALLKVTDGQLNDTDTCWAFISKNIGNNPPVAKAGPDQNATINQTIYFDGSGSYDPDYDTLLYKWDFGDGYSTNWQYGPNTTHVYYSAGNYTAKLYVMDSNFTDSDSCMIFVTTGWNPGPFPKDTDGDGYNDDEDAFPLDPTQWSDKDGDGFGDNKDGKKPDLFPDDPSEWADTDGDGYGDNTDEFPEDPDEWIDTDGDGQGDNSDEFPDNADEWIDTDDDGKGDNEDEFPEDPTEWSDLDKDGHGDFSDKFPSDPNEWEDTDNDTVGDNSDMFPNDPTEWRDLDLDGVGDNSDMFPQEPTQWEDRDSDGFGDNPDGKYPDAFPDDPTEWRDTDGDNVGDNADEYPNDPTRSTIEPVKDSSETDNLAFIAIIILLLIIIIILTIMLFINKKKSRRSPYYDERQLKDSMGLAVVDEYNEYEPEGISDDESEKIISKITNEALSLEKPSDFMDSEEDLLYKIEQKYRNGELSTETYNQIRDKLA